MPNQPHHLTASSDNPTLAANITALREQLPGIADQLAAIRDFGPARIVNGRDGSPVVLLETDGQTDRWLGGSSMPTVSTPAMLADFDETGACILLPTIGTGHEPAMLARRLARFAAVFVHEPDPVKLALAFCVVDLTEPLREGRIVPLTGTLEDSLVAFFDSHCGYEFPTRLHQHPTLSMKQMEEATTAVRRAALRVHQARSRAAEQLGEDILNRPAAPRAVDSNRWLVVSIDPGGSVLEQAEAIKSEAASLGVDCSVCVPDLPQSCSPLARLAAIRDHAPDYVIFLNCTPQAAGVVLPRGCLHGCWFLDQSAATPIMLTGLAETASYATIYAASQSVCDRLIAQGAPLQRVHLLEAGINPASIPSEQSRARKDAEHSQTSAPATAHSLDPLLTCSPAPIAIFADGCDLSPAAAQIGLESHQRLWQRLAQIVSERADRFTAGAMDAWLADAEKLSDVRLTDPRMRAELLAIACARLPATIIAARVAGSIHRDSEVARASGILPEESRPRSSCHVDLWGEVWCSHEDLLPIWRGPIPGPANRGRIYELARVVIFPWFDTRVAGVAREALAAGCHVLVSHRPMDLVREYPQTGELLAGATTETTVAGLLRRVAEMLAMPKSPRPKVLDQHSVSARLRVMAPQDSTTRFTGI